MLHFQFCDPPSIFFHSSLQMAATVFVIRHHPELQPKHSSHSPALSSSDSGSQVPSDVKSFRSAIQAFVSGAETNVSYEYFVSTLLTTFHVQKRRMDDMTCVFAGVGACEKLSVDMIRWNGFSRIPSALCQLQFEVGADSLSASLDDIIRSSGLVSIADLIRRFLVCFFALRMQRMDVRKISRYQSRQTWWRKSTLCKLYQIAHILEAASLVTRCESPGQVTCVSTFYVPVDIALPSVTNLSSIDSILNQGTATEDMIIDARRCEFSLKLGKGRTMAAHRQFSFPRFWPLPESPKFKVQGR
jgi:hypothetical protein